ncbi:hypothetical protein RP20_CCG014975 [Aedes albopictus]|nr:hypothetical protein RP20_CCG014975 [Aedes albopictus]
MIDCKQDCVLRRVGPHPQEDIPGTVEQNSTPIKNAALECPADRHHRLWSSLLRVQVQNHNFPDSFEPAQQVFPGKKNISSALHKDELSTPI